LGIELKSWINYLVEFLIIFTLEGKNVLVRECIGKVTKDIGELVKMRELGRSGA
jgi:hypothetical protein